MDPFQAGAGTSHNMNTNEVVANRAIEILGGRRGDYRLVHPNDHVNMAQSSNDFFPTAVKLACLALVKGLLPELRELEAALSSKGNEFDGILKSGRTHLRDAVPVRQRAAQVAQEAHDRGLSVRQVVVEKGLLTPAQLEAACDLRRLTEPGLPPERGR